MANLDINRLMDSARMNLPGALDANIQNELFYVMNEFCQNSNIWTEDIDFDVTASGLSYNDNPDLYTFELTPTQGTISRLMGAVNSQGVSQIAYMPTPGIVVLKYLPSANDTYTARVSKTVTDPVTKEGYPEFPGWILNKYGNDILDGLLGRMMAQLAKPYSNPQLASVRLKNFKQAVSQAKVEMQHQNVYRGQAWSFPRTFATRRYMKF